MNLNLSCGQMHLLRDLLELGLQAILGWGSIALCTNVRTFAALGEQVYLFNKAFEATNSPNLPLP